MNMETEKSVTVLSMQTPKMAGGVEDNKDVEKESASKDNQEEEKIVVEIVNMRLELVKQRRHERIHNRTLRAWDEYSKNGSTKSNVGRITF